MPTLVYTQNLRIVLKLAFLFCMTIFTINKVEAENLDSLEYFKHRNKIRLKQDQRYQYFRDKHLRNFSVNNPVLYSHILDSVLNFENKLIINQIKSSSDNISYIGPTDKQINGIGRVNCIKVHPNQKNTLFCGGASSGIFKSTNNGDEWQECKKDGYVLGVADIAINSNNNQIIFSSGDADLGIVSGAFSTGVFISKDNGDNFKKIFNIEASDLILIPRIIFNKYNDNQIFLVSNHGFRSIDTLGSIQTKSLESYFLRDIKQIDTFLFVSTYDLDGNAKIFRSNDFGKNWVEIYNDVNAMRISFSKNSKNLKCISASSKTQSMRYLFYTEDYGKTFKNFKRNDSSDLVQRQGFYNLEINEHPLDSNILIAGGVNIYMSSNNGYNWDDFAKNIHVDFHDIEFDPSNNGFYLANDGGVYFYDMINKKFTQKNKGLKISQIYQSSIIEEFNNQLVMASQDNGGFRIYADEKDSIRCDNYFASDWTNIITLKNKPNICFVSFPNGEIKQINLLNQEINHISNLNKSTFYRQWDSELLLYKNEKSLLIAYDNLWKYDIEEGKLNQISFDLDTNTQMKNIIYSLDSSSIYFTKKNYLKKFNFSNNSFDTIAIFPSYSKIVSYTFYQGNLLISVDENKLNKFYIYDLANKSIKFDSLKSTLANYLIANKLLVNKSNGQLIIGTDIGIFYWENNSWNYESKCDASIVTDLKQNQYTNDIYISTWGRGVWQIKENKCKSNELILDIKDSINLCVGDSIFVKCLNCETNQEYIWNDGIKSSDRFFKLDSNNSLSLFNSYNYQLSSRNGNCYSSSKIVNMSFSYIWDLTLQKPTTNNICENDSLNLKIKNYQNSYKFKIDWFNNDKQLESHLPILTVKNEGKYYAKITNNDCYKYTDTIEIKKFPKEDLLIRVHHDSLIASHGLFFQWYKNNQLLENETNQFLIFHEDAQYQVEIIDNYLCTQKSDTIKIENEKYFGINNLRIYPNPFSNQINLAYFSKVEDVLNIQVRDIVGKDIDNYSNPIEKGINFFTIVTNQWPKGVYILECQTNLTKSFKKIIKSSE